MKEAFALKQIPSLSWTLNHSRPFIFIDILALFRREEILPKLGLGVKS
jgi:hypothetical protein